MWRLSVHFRNQFLVSKRYNDFMQFRRCVYAWGMANHVWFCQPPKWTYNLMACLPATVLAGEMVWWVGFITTLRFSERIRRCSKGCENGARMAVLDKAEVKWNLYCSYNWVQLWRGHRRGFELGMIFDKGSCCCGGGGGRRSGGDVCGDGLLPFVSLETSSRHTAIVKMGESRPWK